MKRIVITLGVPLVAGLVGGFLIARMLASQQPVSNEKGEATYEAKRKIADRGDASTIAALRKRVADLEKALAAQREEVALAATNAVAGGPGGGRPHRDPRQFLEELKEKDPARYAQMTNRMAKWAMRRAARAQSRLEFLASVDTSHMSASAKKVHGDLQELLTAQEEIEKRLQNPDLDENERRSLFDQLREMRGKVGELNRQERTNLLDETSRELGFSGNDVKEITSAIQDVIEATEGGRGHGPGGGMPPPQGGGAGGPPAR